MRIMVSSVLITVASFAYAAPPQTGPLYSGEQIKAFDISGLKLGLSNKDFEDKLIGYGFKQVKPQIGLFGPDYRKDDKTIGSLEFDKGGQNWIVDAVQYDQSFTDVQFVDDIKVKIIQKYGDPTDFFSNKDVTLLSYHTKYEVDPRDEGRLCPRNADPCTQAQHEAFRHEMLKPNMFVRITSDHLFISLSDRQPGMDAREASAQAEAKAKEQDKKDAEIAAVARARENTKNLKTGF